MPLWFLSTYFIIQRLRISKNFLWKKRKKRLKDRKKCLIWPVTTEVMLGFQFLKHVAYNMKLGSQGSITWYQQQQGHSSHHAHLCPGRFFHRQESATVFLLTLDTEAVASLVSLGCYQGWGVHFFCLSSSVPPRVGICTLIAWCRVSTYYSLIADFKKRQKYVPILGIMSCSLLNMLMQH